MTTGTKFMETAAQAFAILCITCAVALSLTSLVGSHILGHDESVYATKARSWIDGTSADQFEIYRPIAMPVAGWIMLQFSDSEKTLRYVGVIFGTFLPLCVYLLFRRTFNFLIAIAAVMVLVTSPLFLRQAPLLLNDIPSTALLALVVFLLYVHYESGGRGRSIYAVAPLAALAFYIRYAAITPLAVTAASTHLLLFQQFLKKPGVEFKKLGLTLLATFALFVPHFIYSVMATGSLFGVLSRAGRAANRAYVGDGLLQYILWLPDELGGWAIGLSAMAGGLITLFFWMNKRYRAGYRTLAWIGTIGLVTFLVTGLLTHAEPRYILFPLVLLSGVGIAGLYYIIASRSQIVADIVMLAIIAAVSIQGYMDYRATYAFFRAEETARHNVEFLRALDVVRKENPGGACMIWTAISRPRVSWYTRCSVSGLGNDPAKFVEEFAQHTGEPNYSIVYTLSRSPQISLDSAGEFGLTLSELFRAYDLPNGDLIVYRIQGGVTASTTLPTATTTIPLQ